MTYGFTFFQALSGVIPWIVTIPFIINIAANLAFTPILFGFKNLTLALLDIIIVYLTIVWSIAVILPYFPLIALLQTPYLIWVIIASTLQFYITTRN